MDFQLGFYINLKFSSYFHSLPEFSEPVKVHPTIEADSCLFCLNTTGGITGFKYSSNFKKGDIVVAIDPEDPAGLMVKRIRAVGGETIFNSVSINYKCFYLAVLFSNIC